MEEGVAECCFLKRNHETFHLHFNLIPGPAMNAVLLFLSVNVLLLSLSVKQVMISTLKMEYVPRKEFNLKDGASKLSFSVWMLASRGSVVQTR